MTAPKPSRKPVPKVSVPRTALPKTRPATLGEFHIALLRHIRETGSIARAAAAGGISYRTAWNHIDRLNALSEKPLVERAVGGEAGGGTRLTAFGEGLLRRLSLKTSARNQLFGTVMSVKKQGLEAAVVLRLRGGATLLSRITVRSVEELGLRKGVEAFALVKANWVSLAAGSAKAAGNAAEAAANTWRGHVTEARSSGTRAEVELELDGGEVFTAVLDGASLKGARPVVGGDLMIRIDPSHVILGVL